MLYDKYDSKSKEKAEIKERCRETNIGEKRVREMTSCKYPSWI